MIWLSFPVSMKLEYFWESKGEKKLRFTSLNAFLKIMVVGKALDPLFLSACVLSVFFKLFSFQEFSYRGGLDWLLLC